MAQIRNLTRVSSALKARSFFTYSNQISQPLERKAQYYGEAKEAVSCIKSGKRKAVVHKPINQIS